MTKSERRAYNREWMRRARMKSSGKSKVWLFQGFWTCFDYYRLPAPPAKGAGK